MVNLAFNYFFHFTGSILLCFMTSTNFALVAICFHPLNMKFHPGERPVINRRVIYRGNILLCLINFHAQIARNVAHCTKRVQRHNELTEGEWRTYA